MDYCSNKQQLHMCFVEIAVIIMRICGNVHYTMALYWILKLLIVEVGFRIYRLITYYLLNYRLKYVMINNKLY